MVLALGAIVPLSAAAAPLASPGAPTIGQSFAGIFDDGLTPLDANGAVGPNTYLEIINTDIALYSRTGTRLSSASLTSITGHSALSDPMALWDPATQRFFYNIWDTSTNQMAWGFSKSASPQNVLTDFCNYATDFQYPSPQLTDYPKLGQSRNFLMIGVNVYPNSSALHATHSDLLWITKPQARTTFQTCPAAKSFTGGKFTDLRNADGTQAWTPVPAIQTDPSSSGFVSASSDIECPDICGTGNLITEFTVTPTSGTPRVPALSAPVSIAVTPFAPPSKARQPSSTSKIDTLDGRLDHAVSGVDPLHHTTAVWVAHTVAGGAGAAVAWDELDPMAGTVLQSGLVSDPKLYVFNPAISTDRTVNPSGAAHGSDMVLSLTVSSSKVFLTSAMVSKIGAGAQSAIVKVHASTVADSDFSCGSVCRWGDYGGATPDPAASLTGATGVVWCTNEWTNGNQRSWNWQATP